jgi:ABC-type dipeptide/oligopeptide/nickel transport system permease component
MGRNQERDPCGRAGRLTVLRWFLVRCALMVPAIFGITFLTFLLLDLAPVDRARLEMLQARENGAPFQEHERAVALLRLQVRYGLVDAQTLQPLPVWTRYERWASNALLLRLAGPDEDEAQFWRRLFDAVPVTLLLGLISLLAAFVIGIPLGVWLGLHAGERSERAVSRLLFVLAGFPEVLIATLLLIGFGGVWLRWFPASGLHSDGIDEASSVSQALDLAWHLALPVTAMALPILLMIVRFLRESVSRAAVAPFADNLRAWGLEDRLLRARLLRAGLVPLATMCGSLLPLVVAGSVVVETVFSIEGIGRLAWRAVTSEDQAMVMTLVLLTSVATLCSLVLSDFLQRVIDPRVRLTR